MAEVLAQQVIVYISMSCSSAVIVTWMLFPTLRSRLFMQMITCIAIGDTLGNAEYLGAIHPENGSFLCDLASFLNLYFYPASWIWTTILTYFLFSLAVHDKIPLSLIQIHFFGWCVPLFIALMPLTTNHYGKDDDKGIDTCTIIGNVIDNILWHSFTFFGLLITCFSLMLYWISQIHQVYHQVPSNSSQSIRLKSAGYAVLPYPLTLFICWLPHVIFYFTDIGIKHSNTSIYTFDFFQNVIRIMHGVCNAMIFFYQSNEAKTCWFNLFIRIQLSLTSCKVISEKDVRFTETSSHNPDFQLEYEDWSNSGNPSESTTIGNQFETFHPSFRQSNIIENSLQAAEINSKRDRNTIELGNNHLRASLLMKN